MATSNNVGRFARLFQGFSSSVGARKADEELIKNSQQLDIENDEGAEVIDASYFGTTNIATEDSLKSQAALINEYRGMALYPEVDWAIDDIVNAVVSCDSDDTPVAVSLENVETLSDATKDKIADEFEYLLSLIDFNNSAYEKLKNWYVDGRLVYQVIVDEKKTKNGIRKLIQLDPRAIKKMIEIKKTPTAQGVEVVTSIDKFYAYDPMFAIENETKDGKLKRANYARRTQRLRIETDAIVAVHSGLVSADNTMVLSHLEKARKPLNNVKNMEDALVIYRLTRAPERRAFYVDTGSLPKKAAEEYLISIMNRFKSKLTYNATTGTVNTNAHQMTMLEDFWLPRREGGRGTEVSTLPGGDNLGQIEDVMYFLKKLYKSLNVPESRLEPDNQIMLGGRGAEVSRDEWKFDKFIQRLRRRFSGLFTELLGRHLILKNIVTEEDWEEDIKPNLKYIYASDGYMKEQQELDTFANRVNILGTVDPFVGKYFSKETIEREVLRRSDAMIKDERKKIDKELKAGIITISPPMEDLGMGGGDPAGGGFDSSPNPSGFDTEPVGTEQDQVEHFDITK